MRALLAMINAHSRPAYAQAQRETWISNLPPELEYRFFLGPSERPPAPDEVFLECDDSYCGLPSKVQAACRWALKQGYDYIAKVDDDVILFPREFRDSNFQNYDFVGHINNDHAAIKVPWGFCYILSRKSMEIISAAQLPKNNNDEAWCAYTLSAQGILLHHESRYHLYRGRREDFITPTKRPLRAPKRPGCVSLGAPKDCIAYAIFLHWYGYHATPDEINIKEYYKLFKELTQ